MSNINGHTVSVAQSTQQSQEGHHVGLILFREYEPPCTRTCEKEEGVVFRDIFECLRGVVVEVRSGVFDAPERWDFEQVREERPRRRRTPGGALGGGSFSIAPGSGVVTTTTVPSGFVTMNV